jgi:hypothetical protein
VLGLHQTCIESHGSSAPGAVEPEIGLTLAKFHWLLSGATRMLVQMMVQMAGIGALAYSLTDGLRTHAA